MSSSYNELTFYQNYLCKIQEYVICNRYVKAGLNKVLKNHVYMLPYVVYVAYVYTLHKKWGFPLRISSVNVIKSLFTADLVTSIKEILNGKLHFLCSDIYLYVFTYACICLHMYIYVCICCIRICICCIFICCIFCK